MTSQSLSSGYIQKNFGTVLDSVLTGTTAIVERYSRPLAVIISHKEYERFKALEATLWAESKRIADKNDAEGTWIDGDEMDRRMRARGVLVD